MGTDSTSPSASSDEIDIRVPLRTEFISTIRVLTASLGADAGFTVDEIDDLRLGISEAISLLTEHFAGERAVVSFEIGGRALTVTIGLERTGVEVPPMDELAANILRSVVDEYEASADRIRLVKQATEAAGQSARP